MGIKDATPAEIAGMKKRLADKQAARRCDADCAEAVKMVADKRRREAEALAAPAPAAQPITCDGVDVVAAGIVAGASALLGACGVLPAGYAAGAAAAAGIGAYITLYGG